jgi:hypothetical protein
MGMALPDAGVAGAAGAVKGLGVNCVSVIDPVI